MVQNACLQPSKAFMDAPCDSFGAKVENIHAVPAHLGGNNNLLSWEILQRFAKHLPQARWSLACLHGTSFRTARQRSALHLLGSSVPVVRRGVKKVDA